MYRVIAGYQPAIIYFDDRFIKIFVKDPIHSQQYEAYLYANNIVSELDFEEKISEEETYKILLDKGLIESDIDEKIKKFKKDRENILLKIYELRYNSEASTKWRIVLDFNQKEIRKLLFNKSQLATNTIEYKIKSYTVKYLLYLNSYKSDWTKVWNSIEEFEKFSSHSLDKLLSESYFADSINESNIRAIARSDEWKSIWRTSKDNTFSKCGIDLTEYQQNLIMWSKIYDSSCESMEPPEDFVVEDDVLFDGWLIAQSKKRENNSNDIIKNEKIKNSQEIGIPVSSNEDAEKVYKLNSPDALKRVRSRERILMEKGYVNEQDLPDVKQDLKMQLAQAATKGVLKRG